MSCWVGDASENANMCDNWEHSAGSKLGSINARGIDDVVRTWSSFALTDNSIHISINDLLLSWEPSIDLRIEKQINECPLATASASMHSNCSCLQPSIEKEKTLLLLLPHGVCGACSTFNPNRFLFYLLVTTLVGDKNCAEMFFKCSETVFVYLLFTMLSTTLRLPSLMFWYSFNSQIMSLPT